MTYVLRAERDPHFEYYAASDKLLALRSIRPAKPIADLFD